MPKFQMSQSADGYVALQVLFEENEMSIFHSVTWCPNAQAWTAQWRSRKSIADWLQRADARGKQSDDCDREYLQNCLVSPHVISEDGQEVVEEIERITGSPSHQIEWLVDDLSNWKTAVDDMCCDSAFECLPAKVQRLMNAELKCALERTVAMIDSEVDLEFGGTLGAPVTQPRLN